MKKILIGMLASGENEKDEAIQSIMNQKFQDFDLEIIEGLGNKEAHDALYALFNKSAHRYEYFLKHDADMVFLEKDALKTMYLAMAQNQQADMMMMDVHDWLSDQLIPGQNIYRNTVRWEGNDDGLIVDYHGTSKGKNIRVRDYPVPMVVHSPNPSDFQAFTFGFHRAGKILQRGRPLHLHRALLHYTILASVWTAYQVYGDIRRLYALAGANQHLSLPNDYVLKEYKSEDLRLNFEGSLNVKSEFTLRSNLEADWGNAVQNIERWILARR